ncbi:glutaminase domain-containing protein [Poriferisphaera sp. WC338]|uniref:glutaminase domain-containing protein n=1 Tax=Poriferisphaera sp. WC338 TaxID=3425129 RepID=UPI003D8126BC
MQLMTWTMARLGSRFGLVFEPYKRRVMHGAMGRFLDQPLDLMVGLVEPDGTHRTLPLTIDGVELANCEQFERVNSITYRGYSEKYRLRFEFNIHSVFYPQNEKLCLMPAFYLEMRVNPVPIWRWDLPEHESPDNVKLFIRIKRPDTEFKTVVSPDQKSAQIQLAYQNHMHPQEGPASKDPNAELQPVNVAERIVSLNPGCEPMDEEWLEDGGAGLTYNIPITATGSGIKWRLIWGAYTRNPVLKVQDGEHQRDATFRYCSHWLDVDEVINDAIANRDDYLAHSRRFEKLLEQAPLRGARRHLINQSFHAFLANTFWCDIRDQKGPMKQWFSVWEGSCTYHSSLDVEYNISLWYLTLWPQLLAQQLDQWASFEMPHKPSGGSYMAHDMGVGLYVCGQAYPHDMPVEEAVNYLQLAQTYMHWTGDRSVAHRHADLIARLATYLLWVDRDGSGFATEGGANTIDDANHATQFASKQIYLAVKRVAALRAAVSLLTQADNIELAKQCETRAEEDLKKIEAAAWLGDHYAVCLEKNSFGMIDDATGEMISFDQDSGWDAYSIYSANGTFLPHIIGQPPILDLKRVKMDVNNALRENQSHYGSGHTSEEIDNVWISQNIWRDHLARYLGMPSGHAQCYWDMQIMSNTRGQSFGFIDTYINNMLSFYPRGAVSIGYLLSGPRIIIDKLAPGGAYITVEPSRGTPQRWPLLPLADWKANRIPVCVVDAFGNVNIEAEIDPVIVHGDEPTKDDHHEGLIG